MLTTGWSIRSRMHQPLLSVKHRDDLLTTCTYGDASRLQTTQLLNDVTSAYDYEAAEHALEIRHESLD